MNLDSALADWYDRNAPGENDHYTQPGWLYTRVLSETDKKNLVSNIVGAMSGIAGPKRDLIITRQLCHFFRADVELGSRIAQGLGVTIDQKMFENAVG